nr:hypothetical protein [Mangrovicoccus ximenensis]
MSRASVRSSTFSVSGPQFSAAVTTPQPTTQRKSRTPNQLSNGRTSGKVARRKSSGSKTGRRSASGFSTERISVCRAWRRPRSEISMMSAGTSPDSTSAE